MLPKLHTLTQSLFLALFFVFGLVYVHGAWNEPPGGTTPPDNNTDAPVNIGGTNQIKSGGLGVSSLSVYGNQYTQGNLGVGVVSPTQKLDVEGYVRGSSGLCIGNDCKSTWPGSSVRVVSASASTWRWPAAQANCAADEVVVGGGARCSASGGYMFINQSFPNGNGWYAQCDTPLNQNASIAVYATCLKK